MAKNKVYKVGVLVLIREYKDLRQHYAVVKWKRKIKEQYGKYSPLKLPNIYFLHEMKPLCWQAGTITAVHGDRNERYYSVEFFTKWLDDDRLFTREMFE